MVVKCVPEQQGLWKAVEGKRLMLWDVSDAKRLVGFPTDFPVDGCSRNILLGLP